MKVTASGAIAIEPRKQKPQPSEREGSVPFFEWSLTPHDVAFHTASGALLQI